MFPQQNEYPEFVADQLLTSEHLNQVFDYLDEQERMTRTNLIGIGIVCGLEVRANTTGTSLTITKGCGITSEGYLVAIPESVFTEYRNFDPVKEIYYDRFVDISTKQKRFNLFELVPSAVFEDSIKLSQGFLADKVVLIFVELLEEKNKNCDPNSCDDKGKKVTVNFRPLLVQRSDIANLNTISNCLNNASFSGLAKLPFPRWNLPNTYPVTTQDIVNAYKAVLTSGFISNVQAVLTSLYNKLQPLVINEFSINPFSNLSADFAFINNASLNLTQTIHIQYYYDLFSDIIQTYDELYEKSSDIFCRNCCPDPSLFPRHLLLGEAVPSGDTSIVYRHNFIYSPLFDQKDIIQEIKFLFRRIVFIYRNRNIPAPVIPENNGIKITPSKLGAVPLSDKSIPYYYNPNKSPDILYQNWNYNKAVVGKADKILSYNSPIYNSADDSVLHPLKYDIEPYNFLRIEGHVGQDFRTVLASIQAQRSTNRLPIDVIVLKTGSPDSGNIPENDEDCCNGNLEINYDIVRREWEAIIGKTIEYLDDNKKGASQLIGALRLVNYEKQLHKAKTFMVDDLPQFINHYNEFLPLFEKIESESQKIRTDLEGQLGNTKTEVLAEDLIDHFDEVVLSCKKGAFRALYQAFTKKGSLLSKIYFSEYAKKHPGLAHKAGVTIGGTFIIVSHQKEQESIVKGPFRITGFVRTASGSSIPAAVVLIKGTAKGVVTDIEGAFTITVDTLPVTLTANMIGLGSNDLKITTANVHNAIINIPGTGIPSGGSLNNAIAEGTVIADFYLPYTCCSDCAPITFEVPPPPAESIKVDASDPQCDAVGATFVTTLTISGGKPPYTVDGNILSGNSIVISVESGNSKTVNIADDAGETTVFTIPAHECPQPCDLPCEGEAEKCRYVLWFQKPDPNHRIIHRTGKAVITLTDENAQNKTIDVLDIFKSILDASPILFNNFDILFQELADKLSSTIPAQFLGNNQPMFSYDAVNQLLFIEKFACQDIRIDIEVTLKNLEIKLQVSYTKDGVVIKNNNQEVNVPKFGCLKINKCANKSEEVCTEQLGVEEIHGRQETFNKPFYTFSVKPDFERYYWYFQDGSPVSSDQKEPKQIQISGTNSPLIRFIGIDKNGCFAFFNKNIELENIIG